MEKYVYMKGIVMQTFDINKGACLYFTDSEKFKTNFFAVNFVLPLNRQTVTNAALLLRVLTRATKKYPSMQLISQRLDYLYDMTMSLRSHKIGERLVVSFESDFIKNSYLPDDSTDLVSEAVRMFEQVFFCPHLVDGVFDSVVVESERQDLINSIRSIVNNKNAYAKQKCTELMCKDEEYSLCENGYEEDAIKITPQSLYEFYLEFINTAKAEMFFVGKADANVLVQNLSEVFEKRDYKEINGFATFVSGKAKETVLEVTEKMPVNQGKLALGFRTGVTLGDQDCTAFYLFCEIFGGSPMSKLFMNVREKLSLCYYCRAAADFAKGVMFVLSGIESENRDKAKDAILKELSDIQNGNISDEEFSAAQLSLINGYNELYDNPPALSNWYLARVLQGQKQNPEDVIEKIKKLTKNDVCLASKKAMLDTVYFLEGTN